MSRSLTTPLLAVVLAASVGTAAPVAEEPVDYVMVGRIREEAISNSKVMETAAHLTDVIGGRVTGSPALRAANEWTRERLASWGLADAKLEPWGPFGRGWSFEHASVRMTAPVAQSVPAAPRAWTPGTEGVVRGKAVRVKIDGEADMEKYRGKLAGMIALLEEPRDLKAPDKALFSRYSDQGLGELAVYDMAAGRRARSPQERENLARRFRLARTLRPFFTAEKVLATLEPSERDGGVVRVGRGGSYVKGEDPGPSALVVSAEHYNRIARLVAAGTEVELELDVRARFHDDDPMAYNTVAEIPGTDKANEVVMLGAHLDSWHAGTGATDNAAGVAVVMEAVRILKALDVKPRRTIRVALWTGEEQGLLGSAAYVKEHFATRPDPTGPDADVPEFLRRDAANRGPLTLKPGHRLLSAYFNLDNGTGRIRGIWTQGNVAVAPIFAAWLEPLKDLGATTVTVRNTTGTDHQAFDRVGLPGFQFIQDEADYETRTHHTNMDVFDRLQKDDLVQASAVMASFVYHAAMRDALLPRKPLARDAVAPAAPAVKPAAGRAPASGARP